MKISQKTIILTSLLTLVPILILVTGLLWFNLKSSKAIIEHHDLELAEIGANYIDNQLDKTEILLTALETLPVIKNHNAQAANIILGDILPKYPFLRGIYAVNLQGEIFAYASTVAPNLNIDKEPFFKQTLAGNKIVISDRVLSVLDGQPVIRITYPIRNNKEVPVGLLGTTIFLEGLQKIINTINTADETAVFLIDSKGVVLAATKGFEKKHPDLKGLKVYNQLRQNRSGTMEGFNPYTKQLELFSYVPLKKVGWGIIVTQPTAQIWGNLKNDLMSKALIFILVLLPIGLYLFLTNMRLNRQRKENLDYTKHLEYLSYTDNLTHLYNNRYFYQQIEVELERCKRFDKFMTLIILDIDDFKHYNDTNGHLKGDKVLTEFGQILKNCVRSIDTVARYGGEEFVVMLPETNLESALIVAERIRQAIYEYLFEGRESQPRGLITASIGIAVYPSHALEATTLIDLADRALYQAKQHKNTIAVASQPIEQLKLSIEG